MPSTKINSNWNIDLKLLGENLTKSLCFYDAKFNKDFLDKTPKIGRQQQI